MENSVLEAMEIEKIISEETPQQLSVDGEMKEHSLSSLNKQNSILSLTLDEIQCKSGKNFGCMSMDEFLSNIWNVEENQVHAQPPNENGSFSIPIPLCGKTVDEIWSEIHKEQPHQQKFLNFNQDPCQNQQALGEITLEDFLVKAGVVQESPKHLACSPKQNNTDFSNHGLVDLGFGMGDELGLSLPYQQNTATNMSGNCFATSYQMLTHTVGESSGTNSIQKCHSLTDWVEQTNKKRIVEGVPEVVVERRQRRMIKNRESAARSRARKQAYTVELEVELNQLKEENIKLKQIVAESEEKRRQEVMQRKQSAKRQKPVERLRTIRRVGSMAW